MVFGGQTRLFIFLRMEVALGGQIRKKLGICRHLRSDKVFIYNFETNLKRKRLKEGF